jgi:hypothetical protein
MVTKAGVPSNKLTIGVSSYGRSFGMLDPSCTGVECLFGGPDSTALPGPCTETAGYVSDAEILAWVSQGGQESFDTPSDSDIVVFEDTWVAYMGIDTKASRIALYTGMNFLGSSDWAIDLESGTFANNTNGTSSGEVFIPPTIWESPDPSVACFPPCTFVLPPVSLASPTVIVWPDFTTTLLSSSASIIVTVTTTVTVDPFTISNIPLWPVTVVGPDTLGTTFTPLQSVTPPAITITVPGGIAPLPVSSSPDTFSVPQISMSAPGAAPSNGGVPSVISTPSPIQTGTVSGCTQFYEVMSGDSCNAIAAKFDVTDSDLETWNPGIGSDCTLLFIGDYICVGVGGGGIITGSPGQSPTTSVPPGITQSASFGQSSHAITIFPQPTVSFSFSTAPLPVAYTTGTPPDPDLCSGVAGVLGCGTVACAIFGCDGGCGTAGCDGGCGIGFCGGGCGLEGCGPGCGEGE